jgi:uncharacterized protein
MAVFSRLILILVVLLMPCGVASAEMPFGEGLLFKIERDGKRPNYLFGTMHVADLDILTLPQPVRDAFQGSRRLAIEIVWNGGVDDYMQAAMRLPEGQTLADVAGPELFEQALEALARHQLSVEEVAELRPWAVGFLVGGQAPSGKPQRRGHRYLDDWLRHEAGMDGKLVFGLETAEEHFAPFDRLTDAQERQFLELSLDSRSRRHGYDALKTLYLARDLGTMHGLLDDDVPGSAREMMEQFHRYLLADRNRGMVDRARRLLENGGTFVAVGALHLPGEEGMVRLLELRGYKITRIY